MPAQRTTQVAQPMQSILDALRDRGDDETLGTTELATVIGRRIRRDGRMRRAVGCIAVEIAGVFDGNFNHTDMLRMKCRISNDEW